MSIHGTELLKEGYFKLDTMMGDKSANLGESMGFPAALPELASGPQTIPNLPKMGA